MILEDTICAISTPSGVGGIAVVRVSGVDALAIGSKVLRLKQDLMSAKANTVVFGRVVYPDGRVLDEVLVSVFRAPHSFTGEDVIEIACHGSVFIQKEILKLLILSGCRMATAGEFSKRAFVNGKMDLAEAEAVADVIASSSYASHRVAMSQLRGGFSKELASLRQQLLQFTSLMELELDFAEEDVEFVPRDDMKALAKAIEDKITALLKSFQVGNAMKNGIPVAIVGETNAGKSTLLNLLLSDEKAIVSDIHGTTRDVIEDTVDIGGVIFRLIDTAGIRQTSDAIESIGIERSYKAIEKSTVVIFLIDASAISAMDNAVVDTIIEKSQGKHLLFVFNKVDKISPDERAALAQFAPQVTTAKRLFISAKFNQDIRSLMDALVEVSEVNSLNENEVLVTNMRHFEALQKASDAISKVSQGLAMGLSNDLITPDLHDTLDALASIVGEISSQDVLNSIFGQFCIGK